MKNQPQSSVKLQASGIRSARVVRLLLLGVWLFAGSWRPALGASLHIEINPKFSGEALQRDSLRYQTSAGERFSVTRVSCLLSGLALQRADGSWLEVTNRVAWLDAEQNRNLFLLDALPAESFRAIRFYVGPDVKQNHSDPAQYAANYSLNPNLNGLHWDWQGGYIFLAIEGMWRNAAGPLDGWSYHFARDTNRTVINLATPLDLQRDARIELDFDIGTLLNAPLPLSFAKDGSSTHSREGDPLAAALAANLPGAFQVRRVTGITVAQETAAQLKPLYLPETFTPHHFQMSSASPIPDLPSDNPLIAERVALGEKLFHEAALSKDSTLSCASRHDAKHAFTDPRRYSIGVREQAGTRNAMPLFNLAWKSSFFWDGRASSLRAQALMPIEDHTEMDESLTNVVAKLGGTGLRPVVSGIPPETVPAATSADSTSAQQKSSAPMPLTLVGTSRCDVPARSEAEGGLASPSHSLPSSDAALDDGDGAAYRPYPVQGFKAQTALVGRTLFPTSGEMPAGTGETPVLPNDYPAMFTAAFGSPEFTPEKIGLAIEAFLLTLTSFDSKFDRALKGESQLTAEEQRGFELFMTEYDPRRRQFGADCFHCHGGPLFQSQTFANNGLDAEFKDPGRAKVTGKDSDQGKFATPSLRNIALTAPYMHDGRFPTLAGVVAHYSSGVARSDTLDPNLAKHPAGGIQLSKEDQAALVAFLLALTDPQYATLPVP